VLQSFANFCRANFEEHADPGKKNRNRKLHKIVLRDNKIEPRFFANRASSYLQTHSFNLYIMKGLLILFNTQLQFRKNFEENFIAVEGVRASDNDI